MGYMGWEALVNDKPMLQAAGELVVGEEANEAIRETMSSAREAISSVGDAANGINNATASWGGIGEFLRNITGGKGMDMFGKLFANLVNGKVSGMSMLGLVASALLIFGRFGWLGKIAGAVLGMMLIGSNSQRQQQEQTVRQQPEQQAEVRPQIHR